MCKNCGYIITIRFCSQTEARPDKLFQNVKENSPKQNVSRHHNSLFKSSGAIARNRKGYHTAPLQTKQILCLTSGYSFTSHPCVAYMLHRTNLLPHFRFRLQRYNNYMTFANFCTKKAPEGASLEKIQITATHPLIKTGL